MATYYFKHDQGARNDPKMRLLRALHGAEGLGLYWCIVEELYEQGGTIDDVAIEGTAADLRIVDARPIVATMVRVGLLEQQNGLYGIERVFVELDKRAAKSTKQRERVNVRWDRERSRKQNDVTKSTDAGDTNCTPNDTSGIPPVYSSDTTVIPLKDRSKKVDKSSKKNSLRVREDDVGFDAFWEFYRRKGSRRLALVEWAKLTDDERNLALAHAPPYATSREKQFQKDAERYLKHKTFLDEIVTSQPHAIHRQPDTGRTSNGHIPAEQLITEDYERRKRWGLLDDDEGGAEANESPPQMALGPVQQDGNAAGDQHAATRAGDDSTGVGRRPILEGPS